MDRRESGESLDALRRTFDENLQELDGKAHTAFQDNFTFVTDCAHKMK